MFSKFFKLSKLFSVFAKFNSSPNCRQCNKNLRSGICDESVIDDLRVEQKLYSQGQHITMLEQEQDILEHEMSGVKSLLAEETARADRNALKIDEEHQEIMRIHSETTSISMEKHQLMLQVMTEKSLLTQEISESKQRNFYTRLDLHHANEKANILGKRVRHMRLELDNAKGRAKKFAKSARKWKQIAAVEEPYVYEEDEEDEENEENEDEDQQPNRKRHKAQ